MQKNAFFSLFAKSSSVDERATATRGPVVLDDAQLKHVVGGLAPRGTWGAETFTTDVEAPRGTW